METWPYRYFDWLSITIGRGVVKEKKVSWDSELPLSHSAYVLAVAMNAVSWFSAGPGQPHNQPAWLAVGIMSRGHDVRWWRGSDHHHARGAMLQDAATALTSAYVGVGAVVQLLLSAIAAQQIAPPGTGGG